MNKTLEKVVQGSFKTSLDTHF